MSEYFRTILIYAKLLTKRFFRDKVALFFTFVFPLIFLLVFGSLNRGSNGVSFSVAIIDESNSQFSSSFTKAIRELDSVEEKSVANLDEAKKQMNRGELDTILLLPNTFGGTGTANTPSGEAVVFFDPGNAQTGQTFSSIVDSVLTEVNQEISGKPPLFTARLESTGQDGLTAFDYIFSGLLGFSILSLGFFGPSNALPSLKKEGVLRRLRTTPITTPQYVIANAITYIIAGLCAIALMYGVGLLVFDFQMQGDYLSFIVLIILGITLMFGFGLAIGGWAQNENQAAPLSNMLAFPMMFLSGTFFPRFLMPEWLQTFSAFLPLTPLIDGIRLVIVEGSTLLGILPQLALIIGWTILIYVIAFRVFRWE